MTNTHRIQAVFAVLLLANPAFAEASLLPHQAEYKVKISGIGARLNTELRETEIGFVANHVIRPSGFVARLLTRGRMNVTSEFARSETGIVPHRYQSVDTIRDKPAVDLHFNWDSDRASGTVGGDDIEFALDGMIYDSVSIQYALMHDLLNDHVSEQYVLFDVDKSRIAYVKNIGEKSIRTKAGRFTAIGIQHQKEGSSRTTTLWCVKELGFLPAIIEQHRKGQLKFRATLLRYSATPSILIPEASVASAQ